MQIRRSSFPSTDSAPPCCFCDHGPGCLVRHGNYKRFAGPVGPQLIKIPRFLCKFAGKTISVLPDHLFPYRPVEVSVVEDDFDRRSGRDLEPPPPEPQGPVLMGCLRRAWRRFADQGRRQSLTEFFGQRIALTSTAEELWRAIRHTAGKLGHILLELARQGKSLFGDYRCLRPD